MPNILVIYDTTEGQTRKIARHVTELVSRSRHDVQAYDLRRFPAGFSWDDLAGVVVGASIHMGKHSRRLTEFIAGHRAQLAAVAAAFFSVSLSAAGPEKEQRQAEQYVQELMDQTGWRPAITATFAGGLLYREYGLIKRWMMKRIARDSGKDTDTSTNHEYTDWNAVDRFVADFLDRLPSKQAPDGL